MREHFPALEQFFSDIFSDISNIPNHFANESVMEALTETVLYDFYHKTAPTIEETFVECKDGVYFSLNCTDHIKPVYTDRGLCYTFNAGTERTRPIERRFPGLLYRISLTIDVNPSEYLTALSHGHGFLLLIHDQAVYPLITVNGVTIGPGQEVYISLQKKVIKRLPRPFSREDCVEEGSRVSADPLDLWPSYSKEKCEFQCMTKQVNMEHCVKAPEDTNATKSSCSLYSLQVEQFDQLMDIYRNGLQCDCLPPCVSVTYEERHSFTKYPSKNVAEYARTSGWPVTDQQDIASRYSQVHVYFEDMQFQVWEQQASMNLVQLLSNIGGQMGLYLGASLVSIFELMDFIIVLLLKCCHCFKKTGNSKVGSEIAQLADQENAVANNIFK